MTDSPPLPHPTPPRSAGLFISYFMIWHRMLRPMKRLSNMNIADADKPTVDVLIPCYTEPIEVSQGCMWTGMETGEGRSPFARLPRVPRSSPYSPTYSTAPPLKPAGHPGHGGGGGQHGLPQGEARHLRLRRREEPRGCVLHARLRPLSPVPCTTTHPPRQPRHWMNKQTTQQRCARWWTRCGRSARPAGTTSPCATSAATRR